MAQIVLWSSKAIVIQTWKQFWIFAGSWWPWTAFDSLGIWYSQNASSLVKVVSSLNRILNNIKLLLISTESDKGHVFSHKFHPKRIVFSSTLNYILQRLRVDMCGDFCNGIGFYVMLTEVILHLNKMLGELPKKKPFFFGRSLPNMGGWGGWLPNKVQTLQNPPKLPRKSPFSTQISPFVLPNLTKTLGWVGG